MQELNSDVNLCGKNCDKNQLINEEYFDRS